MISIQILYDALIALGVVIGIAVVFSAAFIAASAMHKRQQARLAQAARVIATLAQHGTKSGDAGELVLH
jgi:hypothetical protein